MHTCQGVSVLSLELCLLGQKVYVAEYIKKLFNGRRECLLLI